MIRTFVLLTPMLALAAVPPASDLDATLAHLDQASARFTAAEAKVHRESYSALIKGIDSTQDGSLYVIRGKDGKSQMGIRTEGQNARIVEYRNGVLRDFIPASKCFNTVVKPGIDTYLSLGFGGSGKDLRKSWDIEDQGSETMDGTKVEKLDLQPKDPAVKANITHVTLWLDLEKDVTLKQVFYAPTGDYNTATYTERKVNQKVDTKPYEIKGNACS